MSPEIPPTNPIDPATDPTAADPALAIAEQPTLMPAEESIDPATNWDQFETGTLPTPSVEEHNVEVEGAPARGAVRRLGDLAVRGLDLLSGRTSISEIRTDQNARISRRAVKRQEHKNAKDKPTAERQARYQRVADAENSETDQSSPAPGQSELPFPSKVDLKIDRMFRHRAKARRMLEESTPQPKGSGRVIELPEHPANPADSVIQPTLTMAEDSDHFDEIEWGKTKTGTAEAPAVDEEKKPVKDPNQLELSMDSETDQKIAARVEELLKDPNIVARLWIAARMPSKDGRLRTEREILTDMLKEQHETEQKQAKEAAKQAEIAKAQEIARRHLENGRRVMALASEIKNWKELSPEDKQKAILALIDRKKKQKEADDAMAASIGQMYAQIFGDAMIEDEQARLEALDSLTDYVAPKPKVKTEDKPSQTGNRPQRKPAGTRS